MMEDNARSSTAATGTRWLPAETDVCTGLDVPLSGSWGPAEIAFWTGTPHYQPWKDVAAFFKGTTP